MKSLTQALLVFVACLAFLAAIALTTGCGAGKKMRPDGASRLAIPVSCIDQVHGTEQTVCEATDPAHPDIALCGPLQVHFTCTKVVKK